jgi:DNA-binding NtrC family response regulator
MSKSPEPAPRRLLSIIELGGYPNFTPLYQSEGFEVSTVTSVRKALGLLKRDLPDVVVAEFNFQSDFRDRTSSLESLLAVVQRTPTARAIVFYEVDTAHQLERLRARYPFIEAIPFPIDEHMLREALRE